MKYIICYVATCIEHNYKNNTCGIECLSHHRISCLDSLIDSMLLYIYTEYCMLICYAKTNALNKTYENSKFLSDTSRKEGNVKLEYQ